VTTFLDQLNLRPQEKRIIVIIAVIVFLVLNVVMVWPHFSDWGRIQRELLQARAQISAYNAVITEDVEPTNGFKRQLARLERQQNGVPIQYSEQIQLQKTIMTEALKSGVTVNNYQPVTTQKGTNEFFEEQSIKINVESQEPQLVAFLYNIGNDPSMIRVRELEMKPADANRYKLRGGVTLAANYAKHPASAPAAPKAASLPAGAKKTPGATNAPAGKKPLAGAGDKPAPVILPAPNANRPQ